MLAMAEGNNAKLGGELSAAESMIAAKASELEAVQVGRGVVGAQ